MYNWYRTLEVSEDATIEEIEKAYETLLEKFPEDMYPISARNLKKAYDHAKGLRGSTMTTPIDSNDDVKPSTSSNYESLSNTSTDDFKISEQSSSFSNYESFGSTTAEIDEIKTVDEESKRTIFKPNYCSNEETRSENCKKHTNVKESSKPKCEIDDVETVNSQVTDSKEEAIIELVESANKIIDKKIEEVQQTKVNVTSQESVVIAPVNSNNIVSKSTSKVEDDLVHYFSKTNIEFKDNLDVVLQLLSNANEDEKKRAYVIVVTCKATHKNVVEKLEMVCDANQDYYELLMYIDSIHYYIASFYDYDVVDSYKHSADLHSFIYNYLESPDHFNNFTTEVIPSVSTKSLTTVNSFDIPYSLFYFDGVSSTRLYSSIINGDDIVKRIMISNNTIKYSTVFYTNSEFLKLWAKAYVRFGEGNLKDVVSVILNKFVNDTMEFADKVSKLDIYEFKIVVALMVSLRFDKQAISRYISKSDKRYTLHFNEITNSVIVTATTPVVKTTANDNRNTNIGKYNNSNDNDDYNEPSKKMKRAIYIVFFLLYFFVRCATE